MGITFNEKPVAIMSASVDICWAAPGPSIPVKLFVFFLNMHPINTPKIVVTFAQDKFDASGKLVDENTINFLGKLLQNLVDWTRQLRK
jgi:hypothetical protein